MPKHRIAQVSIAERQLPGKPSAQPCNCRAIEIQAVRARFRNIWIGRKLLLKRGAARELVEEFVAEQDLSGAAVNIIGEELFVQCAAAKYIHEGFFFFVHVLAQAATHNPAEVENLELVGFEIGEPEPENVLGDIEIVPDTSAPGARSGTSWSAR